RLIHGNGMSIECLKEAGAENMDFLIAVTDNDAVNMLSSMIADRFGIQRKIARVRSMEFGKKDSILNAQDLKVDLFIHPEELAAQEIVRLIKRTAGNEILEIANGQIQVMATRIPEKSPLAYKKLKEISQIYGGLTFRVIAVARGITTIIPGGDHEILPQDQIFIMASTEDLPRLMEMAGVKQHRRHRVMILGGGLVGCRVAELLGKSVKVKLIEKDERRAEELSYALENTEVLHGDGSDANVLESAGILDMDTFVTATGENETNIMSSLLAKHLMNTQNSDVQEKQGKTISLVNKEAYLVLAATSGSDIALNKKILAGNEILKFIRRGEMLSVAHLHGFDAEVVELVAAANSPITRKSLSKVAPSFKGNIIVGSVFRDGKWETAVGDTHIHAGERVITVCTSLHLKDVRKLFLA
ncbi:MAG: Trk system potassium transporter TrkA, partial [Deltaproteobacteria bacterium]|nr:Trk system potassium transporter TrkA [Deltaproteobacteria bacterium]